MIFFNSVLEGVSALYYHKKTIAEDGLTVIDYTDENDQFAYPTLDMLMNPLRKPHVMGVFLDVLCSTDTAALLYRSVRCIYYIYTFL